MSGILKSQHSPSLSSTSDPHHVSTPSPSSTVPEELQTRNMARNNSVSHIMYRAEDDRDTVFTPEFQDQFSSGIRTSPSSITIRDPIAPGLYTRVKKREDDDESTTTEEDISKPAAVSIDSTLISPADAVENPTIISITTDSESESSIFGLPIIQEFILDSQLTITVEGRKINQARLFVYWALSIISCGLVYLISTWIPRIKCILTTSQSSLAQSTHILVTNSFGQNDLIAVKRSYYGKMLSDVFTKQRVRETMVYEDTSSTEELVSLNESRNAQDNIVFPSDNTESNGDSNDDENSPELMMIYTANDEPPDQLPIDVQHIEVEDSTTSSNIVNIQEKPSSSDYLYYFEYRCIRFIYNPRTGRYFESGQWDVFQHIPLFDEVSKLAKDGLSRSDCEHRQVTYGENIIKVERKPLIHLLIDEILHPFNVFQIFSISVWACDNYYSYAIAIFVLSILYIVIQVRETRKNTDALIKVSTYRCNVAVLRQGTWQIISSEELVPGDIIELNLHRADILPCDAILVAGDCIVNESMLTGESIPVSKTPIDKESWTRFVATRKGAQVNTIEKSVLYGGTRLCRVRSGNDNNIAIGTNAKAIVLNTGFNTSKGLLVRNILFPRPIGFRFYRDSMLFVGILSILATCGFIGTLIFYILEKQPVSKIVKRTLDLVTIVVPPALPTCMAIGTTFAMYALKKKNIFCISPQRINVCGKLDMFCFDKTGTLTEEGLDVHGIHIKQDEGQYLGGICRDISTQAHGPRQKLFYYAMSTCHSVQMLDGKYIGDPLDIRMFVFTNSIIDDVNSIIKLPCNTELVVIKAFGFQSSLRRMSVVVQVGVESFGFVKGAPEVIQELCNDWDDKHDRLCKHYTKKGYRVIALAYKPLSYDKHKREQVENDLSFIGFVIFENKIKSCTPDVIKALNDASFRTTISTGDNVLTAMHVAKECHIVPEHGDIYLPRIVTSVDNDKAIVWESASDDSRTLDPFTLTPIMKSDDTVILGCTGHVLEHLLDSYEDQSVLHNLLMKCQVYARMSPPQKQRLVECFQKIDYRVAFCGDGANDCAALKAADVGISLSDAEASVAAPFTSKVSNIRCCIDLVLEGRSALSTSFSCFKFMILYSLIAFSSIAFLYIHFTNLGDNQYVWIDLCTVLPIAVCMARMNSNDQLAKSQPSAKLLSKNVLVSVLGQEIIQICFQLIVYLTAVLNQGFGNVPPSDPNASDDYVSSQLGTTMFVFSAFQYVMIALLFSANHPYQKFLFQQRLYILVAGIIVLFDCYFLLYPDTWTMSILKLQHLPPDYRLLLFIIVIANCFASCVAEFCVFPWIRSAIRRLLCHSRSKGFHGKYFKYLSMQPSKYSLA